MNKFLGIGRLTQDVKLNVSEKGVKYLRNSIAINESYIDKNSGSRVDNVTFVPFVVFGGAAEAIATYQKKGNKIYIEGSYRSNSYTDKEGVSRTSVEINVEDFEFLDSKDKSKKDDKAKVEKD